jgi:hypothetical protein
MTPEGLDTPHPNGAGRRALLLRGTDRWCLADMEQFCEHYHGPKGRFAYAVYRWINRNVFDDRLPLPLCQWALTPYGGCLGMTRSASTQHLPPVITLHPAIWSRRFLPCRDATGWAARITPGLRFTLDVVLHELIHVDVDYLRGGWREHGMKSSHDNPVWCAAIEAVAARLRGTLLEVPPFVSQPTRRLRVDGRQLRRPPDGCLPMDVVSRWPYAVRESDYFATQSVPFEVGAPGMTPDPDRTIDQMLSTQEE